MDMNIDLNQLVKLGVIPAPDDEVVIEQGNLVNNNNTEDPYSVLFGWSIPNAIVCDQEWKEYRVKMLAHLKDECTEEERDEYLSKIQIEDFHWNWFNKSRCYSTEEYKWFFLKTGDSVEAACLIYFPKRSALSDDNIFYVEFIAVAPWNRLTPLEKKRYKGVGKKLLQAVIKYSAATLGYKYGFCLHSLPQAKGFYEHIGMIHIDALDKAPLEYYEIDDNRSMIFAGVL